MAETLLPYEETITKKNILSIFKSFKNRRVETIQKALDKLKLEENV